MEGETRSKQAIKPVEKMGMSQNAESRAKIMLWTRELSGWMLAKAPKVIRRHTSTA